MSSTQRLLSAALVLAVAALLWRVGAAPDLSSLPHILEGGWRAPLYVLQAVPAWVWWTAFGIAMSLRCAGKRTRPGGCGAARGARTCSP